MLFVESLFWIHKYIHTNAITKVLSNGYPLWREIFIGKMFDVEYPYALSHISDDL